MIQVISASAGSGKTTRLSALLLEAVQSGQARPGAVLATTFTNKAAAELQARVRARLLEAGKVAEADALASARIGTVNAVCGQLASELAFELGLSPELHVLDEASAAHLLNEALTSVATASEAAELARLKSRMPELVWQDSVSQIVSLARQNLLDEGAIRASARRSAAGLLSLFGPPLAGGNGEALDAKLAAALRTLLEQVDLSAAATQKTKKALQDARAALRDLERDALRWSDWIKLARLSASKKSDALFEPVREAASAHDGHPRLRGDARRAIELVLELAARALEAYQAHKKERGAIDFVDQERHALELLGRADVRARLEGQLDLVLVDEFQDTSPLQLAIFLRLAELAPRSVWVGDQKQSIYGFRGADPALMDAVLEAVCGGGEPETLAKSHRSRPALVRLTSEAFGKAFPAQGIPEKRVRLAPATSKEPPGLGACFEDWALDVKNEQQAAAALASGVRELLADEGANVRDVRTAQVRQARPGDIAVLCHSNKQCTNVANALEEIGIRAVVGRSGVLGTLEGRVALAGLRLFVDSRDSLASAELARVLYHPGEPDEFLAAVVTRPGHEAFADRPVHVGIREAAERFRHAGAVAAFDAVLEALQLREWCLGWGRAQERLANLDALRGHAVAFSDASFGGASASPAGLVAHLEALAAAGGDDQAHASGDDAVEVSTWHGAKGLEWPITVLFGGPPGPSALGVHVEQDGRKLSLADPLAGRTLRYWPTPYVRANSKAPFHQRLADCPEQKQAEVTAARQNLRLLYVGWTRARDRLVLAARGGGANLKALSLLHDGRGKPLVAFGAKSLTAGRHRAGCVRRELVPGEPVESVPQPGAAPVPAGPRAHPPAFLSPSHAQGKGSAGAVVSLGARVPLSGTPEMAHVGDGVHGFLAADLPGLAEADRLQLAAAVLARWGVGSALRAEDLVAASDRLRAFIRGRWPEAKWRREWPVQLRLASGTAVRGTVDLLLETGEGLVLIDHKTFPGGEGAAPALAAAYSGQLALYREALATATGKKVLGTYLHLPISGFVLEVLAPAFEIRMQKHESPSSA